MRRVSSTLVSLPFALLAAPLAAQDTAHVVVPDTVQQIVQVPAPTGVAPAATPEFRRGQWAGLFTMGNLAYGVGALRFSGPDKAWTYFGTVSATSEDSGPEVTSLGFGLQIGRRTYGNPRGRVRPFRQIGGQIGFGHRTTEYGFATSKWSNYSIGAHGILGATVFVASDLSIGAEMQVYANYFFETAESGGSAGVTSDGWSFNAGTISLTGAFYF